ncbi:MAG: LysR family transcriptional regulator [Sphingomonas sp.]|uniref:LysR substrate-binding domain-containing protein n=1 Tax=Sphingomonas sp. TaxID=28214 RepID=UPI001B274191|nr:LysR substrate-binding domain-containing protein [Sphingomonas sp.]MBO9621354.1 LysR family transcriptional regulator [Sphingomonas sp.]
MLDSPLPSLPAIRAFEAAARTGSFAGAARELGTSAASVSYHVRRLERQTGVALFVRHPHFVVLTPAGEAVAEEAIRAFAALRASFARAVEIDETRIAITTLPTLGTSWLIPRLGSFRAAHAGIQLDLDLSPEPRDLAGGGFDAAIRNGHGRWPGLRSLALFPSCFTPLCAPELRARAAAMLADPDAPLDLPLLGRQDWWRLWFTARGGSRTPRPDQFGIHLAEEHLDAAAAAAGHGVTIGSPILFAREIEAGRLVAIDDLVASDGRSFWLVWPVARQHSAKIRSFRDWLASEVEAVRAAIQPMLDGLVTVEPERALPL